MDPLSITATAVGLAAQVLRAAVGVKGIVEELQEAPAFARDIAQNVTVIHTSLREVEQSLARNPQAIERYSLNDVFDVSVGACRATLSSINDEFSTLFEREDWRMRFTMWWNSDSIQRLFERLNSNKSTLILLVQTLSLRSVDEMRELLQRNQATLDLAHMGLIGMVPSYPSVGPRGLDFATSEIASDDGFLGDRESVLSDSRFAFDEVCIASKAYRKTVVNTLRNNRLAKPKARDILPHVSENHDQESESQIKIPVETNVPAPARSTVPADIHAEVCSRLGEVQDRNQKLQEEIRTLREHLREQMRQVNQTSQRRATRRRRPAEEKVDQPQETPPPEASPHTASTNESKLPSGKSDMRTPWAPKVPRRSPGTDPYAEDLNQLRAKRPSARRNWVRPSLGSGARRTPGPNQTESRQEERKGAARLTEEEGSEARVRQEKPVTTPLGGRKRPSDIALLAFMYLTH